MNLANGIFYLIRIQFRNNFFGRFILYSMFGIPLLCCSQQNENIRFYEDVLPQISSEVVGVRSYPIPPIPVEDSMTVVNNDSKSIQVKIDTCVRFCTELLNLRLSLKNFHADLSRIPSNEQTDEIVDLFKIFYKKSKEKDQNYILPNSNKYDLDCQIDKPCVTIQVSDVAYNEKMDLAIFLAAANCGNQCSWESVYIAKKANGKWVVTNDYLRYIE